jgi:hypothetical protein
MRSPGRRSYAARSLRIALGVRVQSTLSGCLVLCIGSDVLEDAGLVGKFREESSRVYELSPLAAELVPGLFDSIRARADV